MNEMYTFLIPYIVQNSIHSSFTKQVADVMGLALPDKVETFTGDIQNGIHAKYYMIMSEVHLHLAYSYGVF